MIAVQVFCLLSLLLVIGKILRVGIPILQKLYLPSSVGGGICTALALTLVFTIGWFKVFVGSLALLVVWSVPAAFVIVGNRRARG